MTKNWKNLKLEKTRFFKIKKIAIYPLSLDLHNGRPNYRRSLQPSALKREHTAKHEIFKLFSIFVGSFCPPGIGSGFLIRIH
jgi:hypothetical protein